MVNIINIDKFDKGFLGVLINKYQKYNKEIIINNKYYICKIHNKEYNKYCKKCKLNICIYCFKEHKTHSIINYEDIILNEEENKKKINKLKEYINHLLQFE